MQKAKKNLLESYGWYRGMTGLWVHPHLLDTMSSREIRKYSLPQLKYKLQHGSLAELPEEE